MRHRATAALAALSLLALAACGPTNSDARRSSEPDEAAAGPEAADPAASPEAGLPAVPPTSADDLRWLLPDAAGLGALAPAGEPDQAAGQDLFRLINGGAELYLQHGFERAVVQDYQGEGKLRFSLEVFRMSTVEGARTIYELRGGTTAEPAHIGEASTVEGYYGLYRQGCYYFSVTASRSRGELRPSIERLARAVVERLRARGQVTE